MLYYPLGCRPKCNRGHVTVSDVAIGGSAGSRNRGPRPLGAPTVSLVRQEMSTSHMPNCKAQLQ